MENFFYRVRRGDSLQSVCFRFNAPLFKVIKINGLTQEIEEGDILEIIPLENKTKYIVQPFDTIESVAKKFNKSITEIIEDNELDELFYGVVLYL